MRMFGGVVGFDAERVIGFVIEPNVTRVSLNIGGAETYDITVRDEAVKAEIDEWLTTELCAADD